MKIIYKFILFVALFLLTLFNSVDNIVEAYPPLGVCYWTSGSIPQSTAIYWICPPTCTSYTGIDDQCCIQHPTNPNVDVFNCNFGSASRLLKSMVGGNCTWSCWDYEGFGEFVCKNPTSFTWLANQFGSAANDYAGDTCF